MTYHVPIMRQEIVDGLRIKPNGVYLDCTLGGGGHAEAILTAAKDVNLVGIDKDYDALRHNQRLVERFGNHVTLVHSDYKDAGKLRKFISERAKILPRRVTGTCAMHQRQLAIAIKRAPTLALLPYVSE